MSLHVRPINEGDKARMCVNLAASLIKAGPRKQIDKVSNSVLSENIFVGQNPTGRRSDYESENKYTNVGYINLNYKVVNPFLSGQNYSVWATILGMSTTDVKDFAIGKVVYDKDAEVCVKDSDWDQIIFKRDRHLMGAEILLYFLNKVDVSDRIRSYLIENILFKALNNGNITSDEKKLVKSNRDSIALRRNVDKDDPEWMFSDYGLDLVDIGIPDSLISRIHDAIADQVEEVNDDVEQFEPLSLLNIVDKQGKDVFRNQILEYIFVLPIGFRPTIDGRHDKLTVVYNDIALKNERLGIELNSDRCIATVQGVYRDLVNNVIKLFINNKDTKTWDKTYVSLAESLSHKNGLIRSRMQGARIDNSARTVITQSPDMPIDHIGVPISILMNVAEPVLVREYAKANNLKEKNLSLISTKNSQYYKDYKKFAKEWFEDKYGVIGRQPTLFYLGMQAFKIHVEMESEAIVLSPLIVMPFNADFDGDQMHFEMPLKIGSIREVREYMAFENNMCYPKNGEITVSTRHEIIYGLWICKYMSLAKDKTPVSRNAKQIMEMYDNVYSEFESIYYAVCDQKINIYDDVSTSKGSGKAGIVALCYAIYGPNVPTLINKVTEFDSGDGSVRSRDKKFSKVVDKFCAKQYLDGAKNVKGYLDCVNRLVKLGFKIATIWPPSISVITPADLRKRIAKHISDFNERILSRRRMMDMGLEIDSQYSAFFSKEWDALKKNVLKELKEGIPETNGYKLMMNSGAKGDENNLLQIFGLKGRIQKSELNAFNAIITNSYSGQLTGLESFIAAYGSRKGIADKVLATSEPGYLSRKLEHAGSMINVMVEDCGTTDGIRYTLRDIVPMLEESYIADSGIYPRNSSDTEFWSKNDVLIQYNQAVEYLAPLLVGRYCVTGNTSKRINNKEEAKEYIYSCWGSVQDNKVNYTYNPVIVRSPLYCKKTCCCKCYGRDLTRRTGDVTVGKPIGFIAAQAISEPGTQMTMKNFQKGGVVTEANLTSAFKTIENYFELYDMKGSSSNKVAACDVLSPIKGYVKQQYLGNGTKRLIVTQTSSESDMKNCLPLKYTPIVNENTVVKEYVESGDSFQKVQGFLNMNDVIDIRGYDEAVKYFVLIMNNIFQTQDVNIKHFEVIASGMTLVKLLKDYVAKPSEFHYGKGSKYSAGACITLPEFSFAVKDDIPHTKVLLGIKSLPKYKADFVESMFMENICAYVPRALLLNPNDSMSDPIIRAAFGLELGIGSDLYNGGRKNVRKDITDDVG